MSTALTRSIRERTAGATVILGSRQGALADAIIVTIWFTRRCGKIIAAASRRLWSIVTVFGCSLAAATICAFLCGYLLGWSEALVVAWTSVLLFAIALLYLIGRNAYDIRLSLPVRRVVVGEQAPAEIVVDNPTNRRLAGARIEVNVGEGVAEFAMPSLGRRADFRDVFLVPTSHRGVIPIGPARTVRADPIGLLRRELAWGTANDLFVHPRTIAIPSMSTGLMRDLEGRATRDLTSSDVSFHALREYVPGDERRTIHWKSTAKTGSYMVRQFEETRRSHLMVALSLAPGDYADDDEFELAVSVAGSLGICAIRDSRTVSVVASAVTPQFAKRNVYGVRVLSSASASRLLDDLARVETVPGALVMRELVRVAADQVSGMSVAFLVCGTEVSIAELRRAQTMFPVGVEVVAIVCDPLAAPGLKSVAGLSVLRVGYLEDLQKSLAHSRAS